MEFIRRLQINSLCCVSEEVVRSSKTDVGDFGLARSWIECKAKKRENIRLKE